MYSIWSEPRIRLVLMIMLGMFLSTVMMLIVILVMRTLQISEAKRRDLFISVWRPLMTKAVEDIPSKFPSIEKKNYQNFLILWNNFQAVLGGDSKEGLNHLARASGMDRVASDLLNSRSETDRVLAALTIGHLRDKRHQGWLEEMAQSSPGLLGQVAARSLVRMDPIDAAPILIPLFSKHQEWAPARVAAILGEMGPDVVTLPLLREIEQAEVVDLPRLIRSLAFAEQHAAGEAIKELLLRSDDVDVLAACLKASRNMSHRSWIPLLKPFLKHASWVVRVQAVNALSGLADRGEVIDLLPLLSDSNWWVRYRSAQAIAELPFIDLDQLARIKNEQRDRYAVDVLEQVMAEKRMRDSG